MKRKNKNLILFVIMVITIMLTLNGCFSPQKETALMKEAGIEVSAIEYKIRLGEFGYRFAGIVELSADEIISKTMDNEIKKQALLWKIYAIPAMIRSLSINDPLAAGIDSWILSVQMNQYFEVGYGKDLFGEYQDIAITSSKLILSDIENLARKLKGADDISRGQKIAEDWANENPIKNSKFMRVSALDEVAHIIGSADYNLGTTVESIAISVNELKNQVTLYTDYLPKQIKWQVEYAAYEVFGDSTMGNMMQNFNTITQSTSRITDVVEETSLLIEELQQSTLDNVNYQRLATLKALTEERIAVMESLKLERIAILEDINRERNETLDRLEKISYMAVNKTTIFAADVIDKIFWRVLIILALVFVGGFFLLMYHRKKS
ncbi:MAG: hypothetical protein IH950_04905 [Bacteroidetes bacterium]|nr:hypothetical protein [Bacteroidota bacterium]